MIPTLSRKRKVEAEQQQGDVARKYSFPLQMINREVEMKLTMRFPHVTFSVFSFHFRFSLSQEVSINLEKRNL